MEQGNKKWVGGVKLLIDAVECYSMKKKPLEINNDK